MCKEYNNLLGKISVLDGVTYCECVVEAEKTWRIIVHGGEGKEIAHTIYKHRPFGVDTTGPVGYLINKETLVYFDHA